MIEKRAEETDHLAGTRMGDVMFKMIASQIRTYPKLRGSEQKDVPRRPKQEPKKKKKKKSGGHRLSSVVQLGSRAQK